jgi:SAM-dependent methyltransferase
MTKDYVAVVYNEKDRPLTQYPQKLARYLFERFNMQAGGKLLDIGCGRGEFLSGFIQCGVQGYGVDQSKVAQTYCPEATLRTSNIEADGIPYEDNYFDVVYSKSVIEHFYHPEKMVQEAFRVLKPGGIALTLCPAWEFNYRIYFEDYTHRTPFMRSSLRDIMIIHGFDQVAVEYFRQLPVLWGHGKALLPLAEITRTLAPEFLKPHSKWIRFSKEIMLLGYAIKPPVHHE